MYLVLLDIQLFTSLTPKLSMRTVEMKIFFHPKDTARWSRINPSYCICSHPQLISMIYKTFILKMNKRKLNHV